MARFLDPAVELDRLYVPKADARELVRDMAGREMAGAPATDPMLFMLDLLGQRGGPPNEGIDVLRCIGAITGSVGWPLLVGNDGKRGFFPGDAALLPPPRLLLGL